MRIVVRRLGVVALCLASTLLTAAVSERASARAATLRVFAAASLADAFADLARLFEARHPGASVQLDLAGSQQLAAQIEGGARGDVFASADARWMNDVHAHGLLAGAPAAFARNRLVVVVPEANPARITRLQDLARPGVKVVVAAAAVPVGAYSRQALTNLARRRGFPRDYAARVLANVVSEEENVKAVLGKVRLGEADAGLVYRSDVADDLGHTVRRIEIPEAANVLAIYPIAVLEESADHAAAREFVSLALSPAGQAILAKHGFIPVRRRGSESD